MVPMLIDGELQAAATGSTLDVVDPATEEVIDAVPAAGADDVDRAVAAAAAALPGWSATDAEHRADIIRMATGLIEAHADSIADALTHEQGKPTLEAKGEIAHLGHGLRFYADLPVRGIADELGIPEGTVKSRLHSAVRALRTRLHEDEVV